MQQKNTEQQKQGKQKLERERDKSMTIVKIFNTFLIINKKFRQKGSIREVPNHIINKT